MAIIAKRAFGPTTVRSSAPTSAHPDDQRLGVHGGRKGAGSADRVAVDLDRFGVVAVDGHRFQTVVVHPSVTFAFLGDNARGHDSSANNPDWRQDLYRFGVVAVDGHRFQTVVVHPSVTFAFLGDNARGHGHPANNPDWGQDDRVEPAVIYLGVRHEHQTAGELAAVSDDDGAGPAAELGLVVNSDPDLELWAAQVLRAGERVGQGAHGLLQALWCISHDRRVEADAGHDQEDVLLGALVLARVVHREPTHVDALVLSRQSHFE